MQSCIQKQTKKVEIDRVMQSIQETVWISREEDKLIGFDMKEILNRGRYMSDRTMTRSINNIRATITSKFFVAIPLALSIRNLWNPSEGWEDFAVIFRSIRVVREKPNGSYLIPLFSVESKSGHSSFTVIHNKQFRDCMGWMVDSLGTGGTSSEVANNIKKLSPKPDWNADGFQ